MVGGRTGRGCGLLPLLRAAVKVFIDSGLSWLMFHLIGGQRSEVKYNYN